MKISVAFSLFAAPSVPVPHSLHDIIKIIRFSVLFIIEKFVRLKPNLLNFWFLSQENVYVCHIQGDPFKKPDDYEGSQRQWERAHGHERERGGVNLDTLIYVFTVRDHLALFREQSNY